MVDRLRQPVTIGVPVYNAATFIEDTLAHIAAQKHPDIRVVVSVDLSTDDSVERCRAFVADPRFEIIAQPKRLGWIGNINHLIDRVETDDFCIVPHDDLIEPDYVDALQDVLESEPSAAVAFTDIVAFGELKGLVAQPSVRGALFERVLTFLVDHFDAVAFRGLVRRSRAGSDLTLKRNPFSSYGSDTLWMLQILEHGELVRLPRRQDAGYRKSYRIGSQHHRWLRWDRERRTEAWIEHCFQCADRALRLPFEPVERQLIVYAVLQRAIKRFKPMGWPPFLDDLSEPHRALIQSCLAARLAGIEAPADGRVLAALRDSAAYRQITDRLWGRPDSDPVGGEPPGR